MSGTIQVLTEKGEVLIDKVFTSKLSYMYQLSEILESFRFHKVVITFQSAM